MTREKHHALIEGLTARAAADPARYRRKVALIAWLGYAYLALLVAVVGALLALCVALARSSQLNAGVIKILIFVGIFAGTVIWAIARGLFVRFPEPDGLRLARAQAPRLFAGVEAVSARLGVKPPERIYLNGDFNAAAVQSPRFGLFGPTRNWLVLGLPMMEALSPDELLSVVAHEFGHFAGAHGRFGSWIYRQRAAWGRLLDSFRGHEDDIQGMLVFPFVKWYAPRLNAWSFVLVRRQEFEADAAAGRLTAPAVAGRALVKAAVLGRLAGEKAWRAVVARAAHEAEPPADALAQVGAVLRAGPEPALGSRWLGEALRAHTTSDDTHPCLRERLAALGAAAEGESVPAGSAPSAADHFLGESLAPLRGELQRRWAAECAPGWAFRHAQVKETRAQLDALTRKAEAGPLSPDDEWNRADAHFTLDEESEGRAVLELLAAREGVDPRVRARARATLGARLLVEDDEAGVPRLKEAMEDDPAVAGAALELMRAFYERTGRVAEARALDAWLDWGHHALETGNERRVSLGDDDEVQPHDLGPERAAKLTGRLAACATVRRAWLARKRPAAVEAAPLYLLAVEAEDDWSEGRCRKIAREITDQIQFLGETAVLVGELKPQKLGQRVRDLPGALIYVRGA